MPGRHPYPVAADAGAKNRKFASERVVTGRLDRLQQSRARQRCIVLDIRIAELEMHGHRPDTGKS